jgi:hypothetical protein
VKFQKYMENPQLIADRISEWNKKANALADKKYLEILEVVGLDK